MDNTARDFWQVRGIPSGVSEMNNRTIRQVTQLLLCVYTGFLCMSRDASLDILLKSHGPPTYPLLHHTRAEIDFQSANETLQVRYIVWRVRSWVWHVITNYAQASIYGPMTGPCLLVGVEFSNGPPDSRKATFNIGRIPILTNSCCTLMICARLDPSKSINKFAQYTARTREARNFHRRKLDDNSNKGLRTALASSRFDKKETNLSPTSWPRPRASG